MSLWWPLLYCCSSIYRPPTASLPSVVVLPPAHIVNVPVIATGAVFTVTVVLAVQPAEVGISGSLLHRGVTPRCIRPRLASTVAIPVALLVHVPPPAASVSDVVAPTHIPVAPHYRSYRIYNDRFGSYTCTANRVGYYMRCLRDSRR